MTFLPRALLALLVSGAVSLGVSGAKSNSSAKLILEVINRHFTMGRKIRSVYLRVYSDGRAECHTMKYIGDEPDVVKEKTIAPEELRSLEAALQNPELLHVKKRYGLMYPVIDSWMEWDIKVPHGWHAEKIKVLNFSPASARERKQPYPTALLELGCLVWKVRNDVYGDEAPGGEPFYRIDDCRRALGNQ
ncbi:MAG: hypothetical protein ACYDD2_03080 [Candidatus Acidiferrales bacterium]